MRRNRFFRPWGSTAIAMLVLLVLSASTLWAQAVPSSTNRDPNASNAAPDLIATEIRFLPPNPGAGKNSDITPVIKNVGDANAATLKIRLYVEPEQDPPTAATPNDGELTFGLGLAAGGTFEGWTKTEMPFTQDNPQVCVWVDPDNQVAESNEDNNIFCIKQAQAPEDPPDAFEQDDTCAVAQAIANNAAAQEHNLTHEGGQPDIDWISLTVTSGANYTVKLTPTGKDAEDAGLELYSKCDVPSGTFGSKTELKFTAPESGVLYLKISDSDGTYGVDNKYQLKVEQSDACSLYGEPNNSCSVPVDFPLSLGEQTNTFCQAKDEDWTRFEVQAGGKYRISTINTGPRADPQLSLFSSCTGGLTQTQLTFVAPTTGFYYLKTQNKDPEAFGADTEYKLKIEELEKGCKQDRYEPDDSIGGAQPLAVDSNKVSHNTCPKGNTDWYKIDATKGMTFTVETFNLSKSADTKLCLHNSNGEKLRCDRDSGAGLGSRLILGNVEAGTYYFSVQDENEEVAGDETAYEIQAISGLCQKDSNEPDDTAATAKAIPTDNSAQSHNICAANDADWASFNATANTSYVIETQKTGAEGDTLLELYDPNNNFLQRNDDFSVDVNSRIVFTASQTATYRVKVQLYNPVNYGAGTEYSLSIKQGTATPPTQPPVKDPESQTPDNPGTSTNARTLILFNRARIAELYGDAAATQLTDKLDDLAKQDLVKGEIIRLDRNQRVNDAYVTWTSNTDNYRSVEKANLVANEIRQLIMTYLSERDGIKYLLLVGDDRALPFRRIPDNTPQQSEKSYAHVSGNNPTGAALQANYFLSDDFYATKKPIPHNGREVYVPDLTTGRLVESPADMIKLIDIFLANPKPTVQQALVTGYDFVKDSGAEDCKTWRKTLSEDKVPCLIGDNWSRNQLVDSQLRTTSPFKLQSINGHADHFREGIPPGGGGGELRASDVDAVVGLDLSGGLIYTLGCHAGLNVPPENSTEPLDLVEAFTHKGASYVGNTGYGWGYVNGIGLSEQVIQYFTAGLNKGGSIGAALTNAKRQYYQLTLANTPYDEKVMQEIIFYGLPMFEWQGQGSLGGDPFPGVTDDFQPGGSLGPGEVVISATTSFTFSQVLKGDNNLLALSSDATGDYMTFGGYSAAAPDQPIQPLFFSDISKPNLSVRSAIIRSATVDQVSGNFNPTIATPDNEFVDNAESKIDPLADGSAPTWYPPVEVTAQSLQNQSLMSAQLGQYNPKTQEQRVFGALKVDLFYSTATDEVRPEFSLVDGQYNAGAAQVNVKVGVLDDSGIQKVTIHYIEDERQALIALKTVDARYDANLQKWVGSFPGNENSVFYVSAVDRAGNQQTVNNKGLNYRPVQARSASNTSIYLPLIRR
ncbi:hypothetical protein BH10CHL1_BH10CHL1_20830 [soil metagenome]